MTESQGPSVHLVVDGEYVFQAPYDLIGRPPSKAERADYGQLRDWVGREYAIPFPELRARLRAYYVHYRDTRAGPFYNALERLGYSLHHPDLGMQYGALEGLLIAIDEEDAAPEDHVVYVGGDVRDHAHKLEYPPTLISETLRKLADRGLDITVLTFKPLNTSIVTEEFRYFDLVTDVGLMPESVYARHRTEQGPERSSSSQPSKIERGMERARQRRQAEADAERGVTPSPQEPNPPSASRRSRSRRRQPE